MTTYRGLTLDRFQADAIAALEAGRSALVCAPTGTGKTLVADWLVERVLERGQQVIYTAPIKALSNQKFRDYCRLYGEESVGLVTGDFVVRRDAPCRVMTTEILRNMLLVGEEVPDLAAVIVDEIHFLDDRERGTTWEELLIYLPRRVQVVGLSATLSNVHDFAQWLGSVRGSPVEVIQEHKRAVPLSLRVGCREGGLRTLDDVARQARRPDRRRGRRGGRRGPKASRGHRTSHLDLFRMLSPEHTPYLYFVFSRRSAESMARGLARRLPGGPLLSEDERPEVGRMLSAFRDDPIQAAALDDGTAQMLASGIGFHHAGMHVSLKSLVESLYERRLLKVLYCTGTFALGINMPARTVVFDDTRRYDGRELRPLPTREFMQIAGRAGRRGMDAAGLVVVKLDPPHFADALPRLRDYAKGRTEPVRSRFSLSFNSVVNLLERHRPERIRTLVEQSFLAHSRAVTTRRSSAEAEQLEADLTARGWVPGDTAPRGMRRQLKRLRRLRARAEQGGQRTWREFQDKVDFLIRWGYVAADGEFLAGARILRNIQISDILVTELLLEGVFEDLPMSTTFGVLCGLCAELPRGASVSGGTRWRAVGRPILRICESDMMREAEGLSATQWAWDPMMIPIGQWWATGQSLADIMGRIQCQTDISGSLVGAFRRAKDLAGQLRHVLREDEDRAQALTDLIRGVSRDEVEVIA